MPQIGEKFIQGFHTMGRSHDNPNACIELAARIWWGFNPVVSKYEQEQGALSERHLNAKRGCAVPDGCVFCIAGCVGWGGPFTLTVKM